MKYSITVDVERVDGWQMYEVEADSQQEAIEKHKAGESEFVTENLEVVALSNILYVAETE